MLRTLVVFCMLISGVFSVSGAEWKNLNPGGGGVIQKLVPDPNKPGKVYYCSKKGGLFSSDNYGASWNYLGEKLTSTNILTAAVEPGNSKRLYVATDKGLEISNDQGQTWDLVKGFSREPVNDIVINPENTKEIFIAPGCYYSWSKKLNFNSPVGQKGIYISRNRGKTWNYVIYDKNVGRRDVFNILIHPSDSKTVYVAAISGLFISRDGGKKWQQIPTPEGAGDCWGADITPDGKFLYAVFQHTSEKTATHSTNSAPKAQMSHLYVTPLFSKLAWKNLSAKRKGFVTGDSNNANYWKPCIAPDSTSVEHKIIISAWNQKNGLFELTVDLKTNDKKQLTVANYNWRNIFYYDERYNKSSFDTGWSKEAPNTLTWAYSPKQWKNRMIWIAGENTVFSTDTSKKKFYNNWQPKYTKLATNIKGVRGYRSTGAQSLPVTDCDAIRNYCIQTNLDTGLIESWDDGVSWSLIKKPVFLSGGASFTRSNSVIILKDLPRPIVLAHAANNADTGMLYAKVLRQLSPTDTWRHVGGGPKMKGGLPNIPYEQIASDPHNPKRVYIGTNGAGIYMIEDIESILGTRSKLYAKQITAIPEKVNAKGGALFVDPISPQIIWTASQNKIYKGVKKGTRWTFIPVKNTKVDTHIAVWEYGKKTFIACVSGGTDGKQTLELSSDSGKTWKKILDFSKVASLRRPAWFSKGDSLDITGMTGNGNRIYLSYTNQAKGQSYGMFKGTISTGKDVIWQDITENLKTPASIKSKVIMNHGKSYLFICTEGNGLWRKEMIHSDLDM